MSTSVAVSDILTWDFILKTVPYNIFFQVAGWEIVSFTEFKDETKLRDGANVIRGSTEIVILLDWNAEKINITDKILYLKVGGIVYLQDENSNLGLGIVKIIGDLLP